MKKIKIYQYLRGVVILLVLLGHSLYMAAGSKYGGLSFFDLIQGDEAMKVNNGLQLFVDMIYGFHMPLFMMLSGAVYMYTRKEINTIKEVGAFISKKAKRLLIPFVLVTIFWQIPLKYISGYFTNGIKDAILGQLLLFGNSHLWFIVVLFIIFVVVAFIEYFNISRISIVIAIACFIMGYFVEGNMMLLSLQYGIWFFLGAVFEKYVRPRIENGKLFPLKGLLAGIVYVVVFFIGKHYFYEGFFQYVYTIITGIVGSLFIMYVALVLEKMNWSIFEKIGDISFDLYLYSDSLNYVILLIFSKYFPELYTTGLGVFAAYVMRFLITLFGAMIVGKLVKVVKKLLWRKA